jgi:hypothetical protein
VVVIRAGSAITTVIHISAAYLASSVVQDLCNTCELPNHRHMFLLALVGPAVKGTPTAGIILFPDGDRAVVAWGNDDIKNYQNIAAGIDRTPFFFFGVIRG